MDFQQQQTNTFSEDEYQEFLRQTVTRSDPKDDTKSDLTQPLEQVANKEELSVADVIVPPFMEDDNFKEEKEIEQEELVEEPFVLFRNTKKAIKDIDEAYETHFPELINTYPELAELYTVKYKGKDTSENRTLFVKEQLDDLNAINKQTYQDRVNSGKEGGLMQMWNLVTLGAYSNLVYDIGTAFNEDLPEAYAKYGYTLRDLLEMSAGIVQSIAGAGEKNGVLPEDSASLIDPDEFADKAIDIGMESLEASTIFAGSPGYIASKYVMFPARYANKLKVEDQIARLVNNPKFMERVAEKTQSLKATTKKKISNAVAKNIKEMNKVAQIAKNADAKFEMSSLAPNYYKFFGQTRKMREETALKNKEIAEQNLEIRDAYIKQYENRLMLNRREDPEKGVITLDRSDPDFVKISKERPDGHLEIDIEKVKNVGSETLDAAGFEGTEAYLFMRDFTKTFNDGDLTTAILDPDKLNGMVAFTKSLKDKGLKFDKKKTFSENLFEMTVAKKIELGDDEDLLRMLNDAGLSFEDYMTTIITSGSEAGSLLNKLSQMKKGIEGRVFSNAKRGGGKTRRQRTEDEEYWKNLANTDSFYGALNNLSLRYEGMRRGMLVSQLATAVRNFESVFLRVPAETVVNIMDTAMFQAGKNMQNANGIIGKTWGAGKGLASVSPLKLTDVSNIANPNLVNKITGKGITWTDNWRGSTAALKLLFTPDKQDDIQRTLESFFKLARQPEQFHRLFATLNDINQVKRKLTTKIVTDKSGKYKRYVDEGITMDKERPISSGFMSGADKVLAEFENVVWTLNYFNRWQEHYARRNISYGELYRQVSREWGIDLTRLIDNGFIDDVLNDATTFSKTNGPFKAGQALKPKDAPSIVELMERATKTALDQTYGNPPNTKWLRDLERLVVRTGIPGTPLKGTSILPFPRFMFSQMELMAEYTAGAADPVVRNIARIVGGTPQLVRQGKLPKLELGDRGRQLVSRNLVGFAAIAGACAYRRSGEAPADYFMLHNPLDERDEINITPLHPLRPILFIGNLCSMVVDEPENGIKRVTKYLAEEGGGRELLQTFLGTGVRMGIGSDLLEGVFQFAELIQNAATEGNVEDFLAQSRVSNFVSAYMSNYLQTHVTYLNQFTDIQRMTGMRTDKFKEYPKPISLDPTVSADTVFKRPFNKYMDVIEEKNLQDKPFLFDDDFNPKKRVDIGQKFLGLSKETADTEDEKFLKKLGFKDFIIIGNQFSEKGRIETIKILKGEIPKIVEMSRDYYDSMIKEDLSIYEARQKTKAFIQGSFRRLKSNKDYRNFVQLQMTEPEMFYDIYKNRIKKAYRGTAMLEWTRTHFESAGENSKAFDYTSTEHLMQLIGIAIKQNLEDGNRADAGEIFSDVIDVLKDLPDSPTKEITGQMKDLFKQD